MANSDDGKLCPSVSDNLEKHSNTSNIINKHWELTTAINSYLKSQYGKKMLNCLKIIQKEMQTWVRIRKISRWLQLEGEMDYWLPRRRPVINLEDVPQWGEKISGGHV